MMYGRMTLTNIYLEYHNSFVNNLLQSSHTRQSILDQKGLIHNISFLLCYITCISFCQLAQEISEQTSKQPIQSDCSSDPEEISQEPEIPSNKDSSSIAELKSEAIEPKECSNLLSGEVVTVFLEPCPENGKKGHSGTSKLKVAMPPEAAKAVASESVKSIVSSKSYEKKNIPRKRKLVSVCVVTWYNLQLTIRYQSLFIVWRGSEDFCCTILNWSPKRHYICMILDPQHWLLMSSAPLITVNIQLFPPFWLCKNHWNHPKSSDCPF